MSKFVTLCKRTNYPKLGYIIHELNEKGIACRFNGESFHADHILEVVESRIDDASAILDERHGRYTLDNVRDDHPKFLPYADVRPLGESASEFIRGFHSVLAPSHDKLPYAEPFTLEDSASTWLSLDLPDAERLQFESLGYNEGVQHGREFLDAYDEPDNDMRL
jgi:hypothetical protein